MNFEKNRIINKWSKLENFEGNTQWYYLALIGDYEALCKAIDDKRCDPEIKNNYGTVKSVEVRKIHTKDENV